jgi:DNA polymerase-4
MNKIEKEVGITVSIGLSYCKFLAKLSSDLNKPRGFAIIGKKEATCFLKTQPISKIWGVGKLLQKKMEENGLRKMGQLQNMELKYLCNNYGVMGERLYYFSRGQDQRSIKSKAKDKSISNEHTFSHDISSYKELLKKLWPLCEKISARLKDKEIAGSTVTLKLKTANFRGITRSVTVSSPVQMAETLYDYGKFLLEPECGKHEYRLIGIGVSNLCSDELAELPELLDDAVKEKKLKTERAMDKIRQKFGKDIIKKGRSLT